MENSTQQNDEPKSLSILEEVDRVASRVALSAAAGLTLGASIAIFQGSPIGRTALSVSASCALTGTACFGTERIADNAIRLLAGNSAKPVDETTRIYAAHAIGGGIGGGIAGGLFQGRVLSGALLFMPIMLSIAYGEISAEEYRQERLSQLLGESLEEGEDDTKAE
mmetsp:Transcript_33351/g.73120  ORF Transcript_33351/g.73120 Transcript_33351/m.73120 type:complete len:166 (-) Transcript_33351:247-744(-)